MLDLNPLTAHQSHWHQRPYHRQWLMEQATALFDFFEFPSINPKGGFFDLDDAGKAIAGSPRQIHSTTRMVHCFALGTLLGRPGSEDVVDHGMRYIWEKHRDQKYGGYVWGLDDNGVSDGKKQAYGHAFVLLAASSAKMVGHPLADQMIADITEVLNTRFWDNKAGATTEEYGQDWSEISSYRGQNSNMHLTEALMAAFEATGDKHYLDKAERIASLIIGKHAAALDYRVAEHFDDSWSLDKSYRGADMFRPAGTTPGHALEWSRLLLQLWVLGHKRLDWLTDASRTLFRQAIELGWDKKHGGFFYTLDWNNQPALKQKLWWPVSEAIGAAAYLTHWDREKFYEDWYRKLWGFTGANLFDKQNGGWHSELSETLKPATSLFTGKPDIYHALQACLIPLFPATGGLAKVIWQSNQPAHI